MHSQYVYIRVYYPLFKFISEAGVLYIHVHSAQNLISPSFSSSSRQKQQQLARPNFDPYCIVSQDDRIIFKTSPVVGSANPVWEKGLEILVPLCRGTHFSFDVCNGRSRSHDSPLGYARVSLEMVRVSMLFYLSKIYVCIHCLSVQDDDTRSYPPHIEWFYMYIHLTLKIAYFFHFNQSYSNCRVKHS